LIRLQKVGTHKLQLAGTGERVMISKIVTTVTTLAIAVRLSPHRTEGKIYFLQATQLR